jgi:Fic family protein
LALVAAIGELVGRLEASLPPERQLLLRRANQIRTIQGSLAIEGNTLSLNQLVAVVVDSLTNSSIAGIHHAP